MKSFDNPKNLFIVVSALVAGFVIFFIFYCIHPPTYENGFKDGYKSLQPPLLNEYHRGFEEGVKKYQEEQRVKP